MKQDESQEPDVQETLHWYAFNYRQAKTAQAHEMWLELEQFVDRKMSAPHRTEQNFCSRCGKRTKDLTHIHTCTPPQELI
jgi:hypothetical protein